MKAPISIESDNASISFLRSGKNETAVRFCYTQAAKIQKMLTDEDAYTLGEELKAQVHADLFILRQECEQGIKVEKDEVDAQVLTAKFKEEPVKRYFTKSQGYVHASPIKREYTDSIQENKRTSHLSLAKRVIDMQIHLMEQNIDLQVQMLLGKKRAPKADGMSVNREIESRAPGTLPRAERQKVKEERQRKKNNTAKKAAQKNAKKK